MTTRRVFAAATVATVVMGYSAGGGSAAKVDSGGEPVTVHLTQNQDVGTLLPMDSNVDDNIAVLDVVYDGLSGTTRKPPSRTTMSPKASRPPTTRSGPSRSSLA